jgi:hypothetical protein
MGLSLFFERCDIQKGEKGQGDKHVFVCSLAQYRSRPKREREGELSEGQKKSWPKGRENGKGVGVKEGKGKRQSGQETASMTPLFNIVIILPPEKKPPEHWEIDNRRKIKCNGYLYLIAEEKGWHLFVLHIAYFHPCFCC